MYFLRQNCFDYYTLAMDHDFQRGTSIGVMEGITVEEVGRLREKFEWDKKFFRIYTDFRPNLKASSVTPKFYARHEGAESLDSADPSLLQTIVEFHGQGPRDKLSYPETENQWYGWYPDLLVPTDKRDRRLNSHRLGTIDIKLAAEIKKNLLKEPPFTGVPFKL